jgi:integrase
VSRKVTEAGLGLVESVPLADAQDKVIDLRRQIAKGICPNKAKREAKLVQVTFAEVADAWIETHKSGWRTESQMRNTKAMLRNHGKSLSGTLVGAITPDHVQSALADQWVRYPVSARRTLAMFERMLDYAKSKGFRTGDNPAAWKGCHEYRFPRRQKTERKHFAAMPYTQIPQFMRDLRAKQCRSSSAMALELVILTACRTGEALGMVWSEIDWDNRLWTIPAERTKPGREHVVPLSDRALELLRLQRQYAGGSAFVFTGNKRTRLDPKALLWALHKVIAESPGTAEGQYDYTVHGMRSTFRDWAGDETDYAREHVEGCLGHQVGNAVEQAYRRATALAKRRTIMAAWAEYCG